MPIPEEAMQLENQHLGQDGKPTLGKVYHILKASWRHGNRDRELAMHLIFLAWYGCIEPPFLTGIEANDDLSDTFNEVHDYFKPAIRDDGEMMYVVGLMARLFPYCLGNEDEWLLLSEMYRKQYRVLSPTGIDPSVFAGRGVFGEYFGHQAKVVGGY